MVLADVGAADPAGRGTDGSGALFCRRMRASAAILDPSREGEALGAVAATGPMDTAGLGKAAESAGRGSAGASSPIEEQASRSVYSTHHRGRGDARRVARQDVPDAARRTLS